MSTNRTETGLGEGLCCYVCGKAVGDHWFARIRSGQIREGANLVVLCSPKCSILYTGADNAPSDSKRRVEFFRDQDAQMKAREETAGRPHSYDALMAHSPY